MKLQFNPQKRGEDIRFKAQGLGLENQTEKNMENGMETEFIQSFRGAIAILSPLNPEPVSPPSTR